MNRQIIITLIASHFALCLQYFPCNSTLPAKHPVLNRLQKWIMSLVNLLEIVSLHPVLLRFICILVENDISDSDLNLLELTVVFGHYSNTSSRKEVAHSNINVFTKNCVKALALNRVTFHLMSNQSCLPPMQRYHLCLSATGSNFGLFFALLNG